MVLRGAPQEHSRVELLDSQKWRPSPPSHLSQSTPLTPNSSTNPPQTPSPSPSHLYHHNHTSSRRLLQLGLFRRSLCSGYTAEQCSDDEYECDFDNQKGSSSVANIDEWKWKLSLLLRSEQDQEIVSRDKRDRRDYEQISNLAKRMGLYIEIYGKVVVASKVPLPNYRPDLDEKRPQREVVLPLSLQRRVEGLLQEHIDRMELSSVKPDNDSADTEDVNRIQDANPDENPDSFLDRSVMEKVLQRQSPNWGKGL
ncbi:RNA helicase [Ranunculus cassubicifolius]